MIAFGHASVAENAAEELFDESHHEDNAANAFKHCYWSARLTIAFGAVAAKGYGDRHEGEGSGNTQEQTNMDQHNNRVGREIGEDALAQALGSVDIWATVQ